MRWPGAPKSSEAQLTLSAYLEKFGLTLDSANSFIQTATGRTCCCLSCEMEYLMTAEMNQNGLSIKVICDQCAKAGIKISSITDSDVRAWLNAYGPSWAGGE